MKAILKATWFEFENLFCEKVTWIIATVYALICLVICWSEYLRESYFSLMESVPVMLNNFILPYVLVVILAITLSPVFAGDKERRTDQIPAACLIGKKGRSIAKLIGAISFSITVTISLETTTLILCHCFGLIDCGIPIKYVGTETEVVLNPVWSTGQHIGFSLITLICGCVLLTFLVLCISYTMNNTLSAVSVSCIIIFIECIIHMFSFPTFLQEFNLWVFFRPYYLFVTEIFSISPWINLLLYGCCSLPLCVFVLLKITERKTNHAKRKKVVVGQMPALRR